MSRAPWIAQLYGYVVCLVALITFIISVSNLVDAAFERASPLQTREGMYGPNGASLTSFEAFRSTYDRSPTRVAPSPSGSTASDTLTTAELRTRYEALRADRLEQMRFVAAQRLVKHGLLLLIAVALFATHWRWIQRQRGGVGEATP